MSAFPKDFLWGAATSAYQIEGAVNEQGRGKSIWDTFCEAPGHIYLGDSGQFGSFHFKHWQDDLNLMRTIGINSYRFSFAWPRIFPNETNQLNIKGFDFYNKMIDRLLELNITPFATLYHWDLPDWIQKRGGWTNRDTCSLFVEYAEQMLSRFSDRIPYWVTINEPFVAAYLGHLTGEHAPGITSTESALKAAHYFMLAHGQTIKNFKDKYPVQFGIALNLSPVFPASAADRIAAANYNMYLNESFLSLLFKGRYPANFPAGDFIKPDDFSEIAAPIDFLGVNYYTRTIVKAAPEVDLFKCRIIPAPPNPCSDMWEFYPQGLSKILASIQENYSSIPIYVLENGTSLNGMEDTGRIIYLQAHIEELKKAIRLGIPVKGYYVWSLLDNFEWAMGYSKKFGLIDVNYETEKRALKQSAYWYSNFIRQQTSLL